MKRAGARAGQERVEKNRGFEIKSEERSTISDTNTEYNGYQSTNYIII